MDDQYDALRGFTDWVSGQKAVRAKMFADEDDEGGKGKKKKGGKGKKKK